MNTSADELLDSIIVQGICKDINYVLGAGRMGATLILIYAGIDTMGCLDRPANKTDSDRSDFIKWADENIKFSNGSVSSIELYSARCGVLHTYGSESNLTRRGEARQIGYTKGGGPDVIESEDTQNLALISIEGLAKAFFKGIISYLQKLKRDKNQRKLVAQRLEQMFSNIPL